MRQSFIFSSSLILTVRHLYGIKGEHISGRAIVDECFAGCLSVVNSAGRIHHTVQDHEQDLPPVYGKQMLFLQKK